MAASQEIFDGPFLESLVPWLSNMVLYLSKKAKYSENRIKIMESTSSAPRCVKILSGLKLGDQFTLRLQTTKGSCGINFSFRFSWCFPDLEPEIESDDPEFKPNTTIKPKWVATDESSLFSLVRYLVLEYNRYQLGRCVERFPNVVRQVKQICSDSSLEGKIQLKSFALINITGDSLILMFNLFVPSFFVFPGAKIVYEESEKPVSTNSNSEPGPICAKDREYHVLLKIEKVRDKYFPNRREDTVTGQTVHPSPFLKRFFDTYDIRYKAPDFYYVTDRQVSKSSSPIRQYLEIVSNDTIQKLMSVQKDFESRKAVISYLISVVEEDSQTKSSFVIDFDDINWLSASFHIGRKDLFNFFLRVDLPHTFTSGPRKICVTASTDLLGEVEGHRGLVSETQTFTSTGLSTPGDICTTMEELVESRILPALKRKYENMMIKIHRDE